MLVAIRVAIIIVLTLIHVISIKEVTAQDNNLCKFLFSDNAPGTGMPNLMKKLYSFFGYKTDEVKRAYSVLKKDSPYWVTVNEGKAESLDCAKGTSSSIYYPIGILVEPLYDLPSPYQGKTLFVTEYGLMLILKTIQATPVLEDSVFFFSDGVDQYSLCVNSVQKNPDCDALLASKDSRAALSAKYGYVQGKIDTDIADMIKNYTYYRNYRNSINSRDIKEEQHNLESICKRFDAGSFYRAGNARPKDPDYIQVSMSLCGYEDQSIKTGLGIKPIKIITYKFADDTFKSLRNTMFFKRRENIGSIIQLLTGNMYNAKSVKSCDETMKLEDLQFLKMNLGISLPESFRFFKGGLEKGRESSSNVQKISDKGEMLFVSSYALLKNDSSGTHVGSPIFEINDIWLVLGCAKDQLYPETFKLVVIYYPDVTDQWIQIAPNALQETYARIAGKYGAPVWKEEIRNLRNGILWRITDYKQYFFWRNVLRDYFRDDSKVVEVIERNDNMIRQEQMVDYFVHLTMSAIFDTQL